MKGIKNDGTTGLGSYILSSKTKRALFRPQGLDDAKTKSPGSGELHLPAVCRHDHLLCREQSNSIRSQDLPLGICFQAPHCLDLPLRCKGIENLRAAYVT